MDWPMINQSWGISSIGKALGCGPREKGSNPLFPPSDRPREVKIAEHDALLWGYPGRLLLKGITVSKSLIYIGEDEEKYENASCGGCLLSPVAFLGIVLAARFMNRWLNG